MFSTQTFKTYLPFVRPMTLSALRHSFQEWIRKEIVDDDPYDIETFFPNAERFDSGGESLVIAYFKHMDTDSR